MNTSPFGHKIHTLRSSWKRGHSDCAPPVLLVRWCHPGMLHNLVTLRVCHPCPLEKCRMCTWLQRVVFWQTPYFNWFLFHLAADGVEGLRKWWQLVQPLNAQKTVHILSHEAATVAVNPWQRNCTSKQPNTSIGVELQLTVTLKICPDLESQSSPMCLCLWW